MNWRRKGGKTIPNPSGAFAPIDAYDRGSLAAGCARWPVMGWAALPVIRWAVLPTITGHSRAVIDRRQRLTIESFFEDRFKTFVGAGPERERPPTGRFEALGAVAFAQAHDP